jgi:probable rRNA maturation factor
LITIDKKSSGVNERSLLRFIRAARKAVGLKAQVSLLLTSDRQMRQLNRCFRGKDRPTDVISFPAVGAVAHKFAGDLAISLDIASHNARQLGHTLEDEVRILILHGLLHLAGYDHEADTGTMARREAQLRSKLGLPSSLIARSSMAKKPRRAPARRTR